MPSTTIYIRTTGSDSNSGTIGSPFFSAQKGFEVAYNGIGDYVLDFGVGSFGGVVLSNVPFQTLNWPSRISVKGAGSSLSFLGGINGNGINSDVYNTYYNPATEQYEGEAWPATNGATINITSDGTINLGNITTLGGVEGGSPNPQYCADSGSVTLNNCVAGNISAYGHDDSSSGTCDPGNPGNVTLNNYTIVSSINVHGGSDNYSTHMGTNGAASGGNVTLTNHSTVTGSINISAGQGYGMNDGSCDGSIGVYTYDSTSSVGSIIANTGSNPVGPCGCNTDYAGCRDRCACNYDPGASCDDGSCYGACDACDNQCNSHSGCTDSAASCSGWDSCANIDDGSCTYNDGCGCGSSPWAGTLPDPQYVQNGYSYNIGDRMGYRGTFVQSISGANIPISKTIISSILGIPVS